MPVIRILSIDGYGMEGDTAHFLLARLSDYAPDLIRNIDLLAGSSSGGLLALALAAGIHPKKFALEFSKIRSQILANPLFEVLKSGFGSTGSKYTSSNLKEFLYNLFKERTLGSLERKVLIPAFDLDNESSGLEITRMWKMKFFHNYPGKDSDAGMELVDVAMAAMATPGSLPIYQGYADGSLGVSHPGLCAISQALSKRFSKSYLRDIRMLSINGGLQSKYIDARDEDWGMVQWLPHMLPLSQSSRSAIVDFQCRELLGKYYFRLAPPLPYYPSGATNSWDNDIQSWVDTLDFEPVSAWLRRYFLS